MANAESGAVSEIVGDIAALEACIGSTPGPMHLKVIDHLDAGAMHWLAASPLMFVTFATDTGVAVSLGGGAPGFVDVLDSARMRINAALLDDPDLAREGRGVGALFLIPGLGETLRVNGRVAAVRPDAIEIKIEECYVHCAKALIRSAFWTAQPPSATCPGTAEFFAASRFIALGTTDIHGNADLSPKGDPAGLLIREADGAIWFADRPGNRRADSFRNILSAPRLALVALVPGANGIAQVSGVARIVTDAHVREGFVVQGKAPLLVTRIEEPQVVLRESQALARAHPWEGHAPARIDPAAVLAGHVRLSKVGGLQATLARTVVSVPGLMRRGLERDYKNNLY